MIADSWQLDPNELEAIEQDEEGLTYLWMAEKTPQNIRYVTLSRSNESGEVYVERDDQGWSCYGGIEKIQLVPTGLKVHLNANGKSHLGGITQLDITFGPQIKPSYERIKKVLRRLVSNGVLSIQQ